MKKIQIEIFCAPGCGRCARAVTLVQKLAITLDPDAIQWRKLNVVEEIDYAVSLGIRATPAIVINGQLEFTATPDKNILQRKLEALL